MIFPTEYPSWKAAAKANFLVDPLIPDVIRAIMWGTELGTASLEKDPNQGRDLH